MELNIHIHHHFDAEDIKVFSHNHQPSLDNLIIQTLTAIHKKLKELKEQVMKNQAQIDKLTSDVKANTTGIQEAILSESAEIKAAIESNNIDTTELEAAVAANQKLSAAVSEIFTPDEQTGE
jgi:seryl-tRNA synthetase